MLLATFLLSACQPESTEMTCTRDDQLIASELASLEIFEGTSRAIFQLAAEKTDDENQSAQAVSDAVTAFVSEVERLEGAAVAQSSKVLPMVVVSAPVEAIRTLSELSNVCMVSMENINRALDDSATQDVSVSPMLLPVATETTTTP